MIEEKEKSEKHGKMASSNQLQTVQTIMDSTKHAGIQVALIRQEDGRIVYSTFDVDQAVASGVAHTFRMADALLRKLEDQNKEMEIVADGSILFAAPAGNSILFAVLKDREQKKILRESAVKLQHFV